MDYTDPDLRRVGREVIRKDSQAFNLRMPFEMKDRLRSEATQNRRSLNSEIVLRLHRSLEGYRR